MNRVERLVNLVAFLSAARRPPTTADIVSAVPGYEAGGEAARRSLERDKETLRELGLTLERVPLDPLAAGGTQHQGYRLGGADRPIPDPGLTMAERSALALAAAVAAGAAGPLREDVARSDDVAGAADLAGITLDEAVPAALVERLYVAVSERRRIRIDYESPGPPVQVKTRELEPYGLARRRGHWYVVGLDSLSGEVRSFRVDRFRGETRIGGSGGFSRPEGFSVLDAVPARGWEAGHGAACTVTVAVDPDWWWWVAPQAEVAEPGPEAAVAGHGWPTLQVAVRNRDAFVSWVLSLVDAAVVVAPADVRDEVVARLDALVEGP